MMTPLDEAAAAGNQVIVQLLLGMGANPNSRDRDAGRHTLGSGREGHLEVVRQLLDAGANVNAVSSYGTSALHCAANGGHALIVKLLLSRHVDALKANCHGWTALHHAAYMGHSQVAQCLLEDERVRMNASQQDNHGWSVLHLAVYNRDLATIEVLLAALLLKSLGACLMRVALHQKNGSIFDHRAIPIRPSVSWLLASHAVAEPSQGYDEL
jgi:ankyrin repeat protein